MLMLDTAAATILTNPAPHVMKTYNLAAPPVTAKSLATIFSKVSRHIRYISFETYLQKSLTE